MFFFWCCSSYGRSMLLEIMVDSVMLVMMIILVVVEVLLMNVSRVSVGCVLVSGRLMMKEFGIILVGRCNWLVRVIGIMNNVVSIR